MVYASREEKRKSGLPLVLYVIQSVFWKSKFVQSIAF